MLFKRKKYKLFTDDELLLHYKSDQNSGLIGEIYNRYSHLMLGLCLKYLKDEQLSEDVVMDIFEKLPLLLIKHEIKYLKSWIYMVTKNECLMLLRKNNFETVTLDKPIEEEPNLISEKILLEVKIEKVYESMKELKPHHEKALKLFYLEKKSYIEISNILDISVKQVKSDVQNAKRNLKIKLEEDAVFKSAK